MDGQASSKRCRLAVAPEGNNICIYGPMRELPDDIVSHIFSYLTMKGAYKTRLLCRRWRYLCIPLQNLELNCNFIFNTIPGHSPVRDKNDILRFESNLVRKVDQYLHNLPSKKLVSFDISFTFHAGSEFASNVDNWISFALRLEAERINLNVSFSPSTYRFPCHLLPLGRGSHLKFLRLRSCELRPPLEHVNRLNSLKFLELDRVVLEERDMDLILCGCMNLESLILRSCYRIRLFRLESHHVPKLKWLAVLGDFCNIQNIEINKSVRLERLEYKGMGRRAFKFRKPLPPLKKVFLWFPSPCKRKMDYMFKSLPRDFPLPENLTLCWLNDKVMATLPASITAFRFLKHLHLILRLTSKFDLLSLTYILNVCPILEEFHLSLHKSSSRGDTPEKEYSSRQYPQLKEVRISGFHRKCNAAQLAIYLLKNAVALERMIINGRTKLYHGRDEWTYYSCSDYKKLSRDEIHGLLFKEKVNPIQQRS